MNDRAVSVLENYECKVLRTYKGRSAIICETDCGLKILKEYRGTEERVAVGNRLLEILSGRMDRPLEQYVRTGEGNFITKDREQNTYILKDFYEGKECSASDSEDLTKAFSYMARLHKQMYCRAEDLADLTGNAAVAVSDTRPGGENKLLSDTEKKTRELKRARNFLRKKSSRNEFENFLLLEYDRFLNRAVEAEQNLKQESFSGYYRETAEKGMFCHGDFQYHNVVFAERGITVLNFEKYRFDSVMKDFSLFFRKVMEKNGWNTELAKRLLDAYQKERVLEKEEMKQLILRLSYPEKFWKIVNCYLNTKKTLASEFNHGKLLKTIAQEEEAEKCISFLEAIVYNNS